MKMNRVTHAWIRAGLLAECLALSLSSAQANLMFNTNLDTSPLVGNAVGPFSLDFQLIDGGGAVSNTATLSHFNFGEGVSQSSRPLYTRAYPPFWSVPAGYGRASASARAKTATDRSVKRK